MREEETVVESVLPSFSLVWRSPSLSSCWAQRQPLAGQHDDDRDERQDRAQAQGKRKVRLNCLLKENDYRISLLN